MDDLAPVVIIAGPTASGKTELALKVAEMLNGEIINADSMQVYAELCILTARPDAAELARAPHHLFGNLPASERCSAGRWLNLAKAALADIHARGRLPVVCGGTGLYLKALTDGLAAVPEVPDDMVQAITRHLDDVGGEAFRTELGAVDPGAAKRLPASDRQRLIRAAAVYAATGRTLSDWQREQSGEPGYAARYCTVLLMPPRDEMYAAIDRRFDTMMAKGAMDEIKAFAALGLAQDLPASRAVAVAETNAGPERAESGTWRRRCSKAKTASRHLAKRQMSLVQTSDRTDLRVEEKYSERDSQKIFSFIRDFLLTLPS